MQGFGRFEPDMHGRLCYRPPLPSVPRIDDVWAALQRAQQAVEAFDRALAAFPVADVVGKLFARLDAVHSSGAEGTTTTFTDLMHYQSWPARAKDPEDARQVAATAEAFDALSDATGGAVPSFTDAALRIHRRLFERAPDPMIAAGAGLLKVHPNGTYDPEFAGGFFYYTAPGSTGDALKDWEGFTAQRDDRPELIRQALSHWMFEHIHPLPDGNGRVGRLLVPLALKRKGTVERSCAFLGEAVHRNKTAYVDALKDARRTGTFAPWTRLFCAMVAETADANLDRLEALGRIYALWQSKTRSLRAHSVVHDLLPWILTKPSFTIGDALSGVGASVTFQTMNSGVRRLIDRGIVVQDSGRTRDRRFVAPAVIRLFEPETALPD